MQQTQVLSLGGKDPLEKEMLTYSSMLAWESHVQRGLFMEQGLAGMERNIWGIGTEQS